MEQEQFDKQREEGLSGWFVLEIFGHQRYAGYVTVQNIGISAMVRVDIPPLEERERITKRGFYGPDGAYIPPGSTVKDGAVNGYTKLFGVGAIYAMTPCTKEACLAAVEELQPRPMTPISLATPKQIESPEEEDDDEVQEQGEEEEYEHQ